ncbi:MAG TPA: hypothetical protein PK309_08690 [Bacillota bacterium]|nr:hypothetical protein [Bacillota bacterium]
MGDKPRRDRDMAAPTAEQLNQEMAKRIAEDVADGYSPVAYLGDHRREVAAAYGLELVGSDETTGCVIYTHPESSAAIPYYTWDPNLGKHGEWADWSWDYEGAIGGEVDADALWYISRGCSPSDEDVIELLRARGWDPEDIAPYVREVKIGDGETARYLNGKLCDISTAKEIEEIESPTPYAGDFEYVAGTIYQAPEGHRFAVGSGGAMSIFAQAEEGNPGWYRGGEGWVLLED